MFPYARTGFPNPMFEQVKFNSSVVCLEDLRIILDLGKDLFRTYMLASPHVHVFRNEHVKVA